MYHLMAHQWGDCVSPVLGASAGLCSQGLTFPSWLVSYVSLRHSETIRGLANGKQ